MAIVPKYKDIKIDESITRDYGDCTRQQAKEVLMKYGYSCKDSEEKPVKESAYPILEEVAKLLEGDRKDSYGDAVTSFTHIADYWNDYLYHKYSNQFSISPYDVAMMMALFKIAREENKHKYDNLVDIIGYTALANTLMESK